jgi:hypothetical protein
LSPEIVHFKHPLDRVDPALAPNDWYIKGWQYVKSLCPHPLILFTGLDLEGKLRTMLDTSFGKEDFFISSSRLRQQIALGLKQ